MFGICILELPAGLVLLYLTHDAIAIKKCKITKIPARAGVLRERVYPRLVGLFEKAQIAHKSWTSCYTRYIAQINTVYH